MEVQVVRNPGCSSRKERRREWNKARKTKGKKIT
jgi:hypothetical protein